MAPKATERKNPELDATDGLPPVPVGPAPAFAAKTPAYVNQLRESVIREVNGYTRTLISQSEERLREAIRALVAELAPSAVVAPQARPVDLSDGARGPSTPQGKRSRSSDEEGHDSPIKAIPLTSTVDVAKIGVDAEPANKKVKLDNAAPSDAHPTTNDKGPAVSNARQSKHKGKESLLTKDEKQDEVTTNQHENAFDYPDISTLEAGEASFVPLRRYWTFHRALIPKTNGRAPFMRISDLTGHRGILDKYIFAAISCVTLSIDCHRQITWNESDSIGKWSEQAFFAWTNNRVDPRAFPLDERAMAIHFTPNTKEFFLPFVVSDNFAAGRAHAEGPMHTLLLYCQREAPGKGLTVRILDSAPRWYNYRKATWNSVIEGMLRKIGLEEPVTWLEQKVYRQDNGSQACGLFVILNAWVAVMHLEFNLVFKATHTFYDEAVKLVNLALSGYLDSSMLYHWLLHHAYIKTSPAYPKDTVHKFERSFAAASDETFERLRLDDVSRYTRNALLRRPDGSPLHPESRLAPHERTDKEDIRAAWESAKKDTEIDAEQLWTKEDRKEFTRLYPNEVHRRQRVNETLKDKGRVL